MRTLAIGIVAMLAAVSMGAASSQAPTAAEILRVLGKQSGEPLVSVVEGRTHKDGAGAWYVEADTAARASTVTPLCERTRVYAAMTPTDLSRGNWSVVESERGTVVAVKQDGSAACEKLPSASFFSIADKAIFPDVVMLLDAVHQLEVCARKRPDCKTRISATPWRLLDNVGDAAGSPTVLAVDLDPNLSTQKLKFYGIRFSLGDSKQDYRANISVVDGRVKEVEIGQIYR